MITVTLNEKVQNGATIVLTPEPASGSVQWNCLKGDLEQKYRPAECRKAS